MNADKWEAEARKLAADLNMMPASSPERLYVIQTALAGAYETAMLERPRMSSSQTNTANALTLGGGVLALATVTYDQPKEFPAKVKIFVFGVGTGIVERAALSDDGAPGKQSEEQHES